MKMLQFSKRSAASDTAFDRNVFFAARLKLTGLYVLIVAVIILGFSLFLYQSISRNLKDASDDEFSGIESHQHFVDNTLGNVGNELILADLVILFGAAGVSFALAGKTLKPIQISVEAQKAFAANASHELRTPLAVMRSDIEVFLRNPSQSQKQAHETMKSNLEEIGRMSGIVEDLLLLARSDNGSVLESKHLDMSQVMRNTVQRIQSLADSKRIRVAIEDSGQAMIKGVHASLERMILNILQNAIDHTPAGGIVTAKVRKEGGFAVVRISDTGSGIPEKDLPHIFKRFYKGESAKGTGLGLSIVKEIVDQHEGDISFESILRKGTTVTICFPSV